MRKNEYNSLGEFKSRHTGVWNFSDSRWFGSDFSYRGVEYGFNAGSMYESRNTLLADGREAVFGSYRKNTDKQAKMSYALPEEFATADDAPPRKQMY